MASTSWSHEDGECRHRTTCWHSVLSWRPSSPGERGAGLGHQGAVEARVDSTRRDGADGRCGRRSHRRIRPGGDVQRRQRRSAQWYGDYPHAGGRGTVGLRQLAIDFERGGDLRRRAEGHLVGALVEDLYRAYRGRRPGPAGDVP
ncbi:hypothetical protein NKH18_22445 [Streptomyces sp. M10(2022)]